MVVAFGRFLVLPLLVVLLLVQLLLSSLESRGMNVERDYVAAADRDEL